MRVRSFLAAGAAVFLACAGVVALPASPAYAASTYTCKLSFATTNPLPKWNTTASMTASPASAKAGQTVNVSIKMGQYTNGPVTLAKGKLKPQGTVGLSGSQSGTMRVTGPAVPTSVGALAKFTVPTMTGSFKAAGAGSVTLTMKQVQFVYPGPPPVTTTCTAAGSGESMGSVKVASSGGGGTTNTSNNTNNTTGGTGNTGGGNNTSGGGGQKDLAQTGPVSPSVLIAGLIAFQLGLIVYIRSRRALR